MNCRIETLLTTPAVVRVSGRLGAAHVPDLLAACANHPDRVQLDLSELEQADCAGWEALRRLRAEGVDIIHASPFIESLLGPPLRLRPAG